MSVFSVLVKSTEKTGIEAAAAAAGKENIGDVPLMGLVPSDLYSHRPGASEAAVSFPTPPHRQSRTNCRYEMLFSSHTNFCMILQASSHEQANASRVCNMTRREGAWRGMSGILL
jgi:hypothetical protein